MEYSETCIFCTLWGAFRDFADLGHSVAENYGNVQFCFFLERTLPNIKKLPPRVYVLTRKRRSLALDFRLCALDFLSQTKHIAVSLDLFGGD